MEGFEYKVRFHLQRGQHYMHWQIKAWDGTVKYLDPNKYQLELYGCKLINKINAARKVNLAGKKDVCGWIECDNFDINEGLDNNLSMSLGSGVITLRDLIMKIMAGHPSLVLVETFLSVME